MQLFHINQSSRSSKITINAHTTSCWLHQRSITSAVHYNRIYSKWNWALEYSSAQYQSFVSGLHYSRTVNWMLNIERDPNVNNAWYCGGILRLCNITSNKRFWSGGNDIDSLCAHQIWNMKHWALAKSTNVDREEPGSHLTGSSSSLSPLLEIEMENINYLNI